MFFFSFSLELCFISILKLTTCHWFTTGDKEDLRQSVKLSGWGGADRRPGSWELCRPTGGLWQAEEAGQPMLSLGIGLGAGTAAGEGETVKAGQGQRSASGNFSLLPYFPFMAADLGESEDGCPLSRADCGGGVVSLRSVIMDHSKQSILPLKHLVYLGIFT